MPKANVRSYRLAIGRFDDNEFVRARIKLEMDRRVGPITVPVRARIAFFTDDELPDGLGFEGQGVITELDVNLPESELSRFTEMLQALDTSSISLVNAAGETKKFETAKRVKAEWDAVAGPSNALQQFNLQLR